jgi:hypothetical protein
MATTENSTALEGTFSGFTEFVRRYLKQLNGSSDSQPVTKQYRNSILANDEQTVLIPWLLVGMTDANGPGCFPGKKIAVMKDSSFALVPESAQAGDIICRLIDSPLPYLLRRKTIDSNCTPKYDIPTSKVPLAALDAKIAKFFVEKKSQIKGKIWEDFKRMKRRVDYYHRLNVKLLFSHLDTSRIEHFNFIGNCFLDWRRESGKKWDNAVYNEQFILALH